MALMNSYNLEEDIVANLKENGGNMLLKDLIVRLIQKYGISFSDSQYKKVIKDMPLKIYRNPEYTPTGKLLVGVFFKPLVSLTARAHHSPRLKGLKGSSPTKNRHLYRLGSYLQDAGEILFAVKHTMNFHRVILHD